MSRDMNCMDHSTKSLERIQRVRVPWDSRNLLLMELMRIFKVGNLKMSRKNGPLASRNARMYVTLASGSEV